MGIYVRKVKQGSRTYHYLVTSFREGQKVKQKKLKYLGINPNEEDIRKAKSDAILLLGQTKETQKPKSRKKSNEVGQ
jgi:hypothetical protein